MAEFHHRKLLLDHTNKYASSSSSSSSCYICYVCPKECYISHPPPPPPPPPPADSKSHPMAIVLILMLSVLGAAFLFLSYLTLTKYRSRRNPENALRSSSASFDEVLDHPIWYIRTVGLPRSTIDSISIVEYSCNSIMIGKSDCSVCLSEFRENEHLRLLPKCGHAFHVPCIDTWLTSHKNCPVCRAPILIGSDSGRPGPSGREAGNHDQLGDDDILTLTSKLDRINGNDGVCDSEKEEGCSDGKTETSEMGGKREDYEETVSMHSISSDGVSSTQIESRGDD